MDNRSSVLNVKDFENQEDGANAPPSSPTLNISNFMAQPSAQQEVKPEVGRLESFGRGAAQGFALGYSPELISAAKTLSLPFGSDPQYLQELQRQKRATQESWEQHPWMHGAGTVASIAPAVFGAMISAPATGTAAAGTGLARAGSYLANASNIGSLAAGGLRGLAGASEGLLPAATRGTANIMANPVVQGAVYGSSEGDTASERAQNAAIGAAGAKILPPVIEGAASLAKNIISKPISYGLSKISGRPSEREIAANAAHELGITLPSVATPSGLSGALTTAGAKIGTLNSAKNAAAQTLAQIDEKLTGIHGNILPQDAGNAIRNSFVNDWLRGSSQNSMPAMLDAIYRPIQPLSNSTESHGLRSVYNLLENITSSSAYTVAPKRVNNTIDVVRPSLEAYLKKGGLTFSEMRALRQEISDIINFNNMPGSSGLNEGILKQLRAAVTNDMKSAAERTGGQQMLVAFNNAEREASKLYNLSEVLSKKLGGKNPDAPGSIPGASVFNNLSSLASISKGDYNTLLQIKQVVSPEAWDTFSRGILANNLPSGQKGGFNFGGFFKGYNSMSPQAKEAIFGTADSNEIRKTLENVAILGQTTGGRLDNYARQATGQSPYSTAGIAGAAVEAAAMGVPAKTMTILGGAAGADAIGAQNIAKALPPATERAKFFQYIQSNPEAQNFINGIRSTVLDPTLQATANGQQFIHETLKRAAGPISAQVGAEITPDQLGALIVSGIALSGAIAGKPQSTGGRIERREGGRVGIDHSARAASLVRAAETAKKQESKTTEPLLQAPDERIVKALSLANEAI